MKDDLEPACFHLLLFALLQVNPLDLCFLSAVPGQSTRAPDCLMTCAHFVISDLMYAANCSRVLPTATMPSPLRRCLVSGTCMIFATWALRTFSTSAGVPAGASTPYHWLDS